MRTGLLGGTFDPPHLGHIRMAKIAGEVGGLDRVLFVPCNQQPLKAAAPMASPFHRAAMVALAVRGNGNWLLETSELERGGISYTVETLAELRGRFPSDAFFLILGSDSHSSLPQWARYLEIVREAGLIVIPRGGGRGEEAVRAEEIPGAWVLRADCRPLAVSSTQVRARLAGALPVRGLVPAAVASYIRRQGLYGPSPRPDTQRRTP